MIGGHHLFFLCRRSCWSVRRTWRRRSTGRPLSPRTCPGSTRTLANSPSAPGTTPMVSGPLMVSTGCPVCNGSMWRNHRYRVFLLDQDSAYTGAATRALESSSSPDTEYPHYSPYTHSTSFLHHASSSRNLSRHNLRSVLNLYPQEWRQGWFRSAQWLRFLFQQLLNLINLKSQTFLYLRAQWNNTIFSIYEMSPII